MEAQCGLANNQCLPSLECHHIHTVYIYIITYTYTLIPHMNMMSLRESFSKPMTGNPRHGSRLKQVGD